MLHHSGMVQVDIHQRLNIERHMVEYVNKELQKK